MTPHRRTPPLQNCVGCRGNPRRTWQRHYLCPKCSAGVARPLAIPPRPSQLDTLPGERFEDLFGGAA